ncbi:farnesol dehydrogenase-like [Photinus pyralis]|uniref:farnesol dehydrogenase-like n=1 Tax=Photinus pyralis TaxID=7054 RepID=UPI001266E771|nr:farnesol dehydrogenase-like [Photinus pyralis]
MNRWEGKVAVVTGASSGIGLAIAEHLVNVGMKVVGLARRKEKLEDLERKLVGRRGKFFPVKADVTQENEILEAFRWATKNVGAVHVLVNNAGILRPGGLMDGLSEHWVEVLHTNVLGLCIATREAVKIMRDNKIDGHVIHINSIAGHRIPDFPEVNVYPATKHAVSALTEILRHELNHAGSRIKITSISPGLVRSEILVASQRSPEMIQAMDAMPILEAADIAEAVLYVLGTPPHVQIHELIIQPVGEKL